MKGNLDDSFAHRRVVAFWIGSIRIRCWSRVLHCFVLIPYMLDLLIYYNRMIHHLVCTATIKDSE